MTISRICISINNRCNLKCKYCHFKEKDLVIKDTPMDIVKILCNVRDYIQKYNIPLFKIGFVGNGEPLLDFDKLKLYIESISDLLEKGTIQAYTITNGTKLTKEMIYFLSKHNVNICFSLDGPKFLHDRLRANSFDKTMAGINLYRSILNKDPSLNATVGREILEHSDEVISFFRSFSSKITFSKMTGKFAITFDEYYDFLQKASQYLNIRRGGHDCAMYGGQCAAGVDNFYFANNKVWICGNCVDLDPICEATIPLDLIKIAKPEYNRVCYHDFIKMRVV